MVGLFTRQRLRSLLDEGDITDSQVSKFYSAVRVFYKDAVSQSLKKLPFTDYVLSHAKFVKFEFREGCRFYAVQIFL